MLEGSAPPSEVCAPQLRRRLQWLLAVLTIAFLTLFGRLWQLQVMRGEQYFERARENVLSEKHLPSVRGKIVDRRGVAIADNRPAFNLYATPHTMTEQVKGRLFGLLSLTDEEIDRFESRLAVGRKRHRNKPTLVLTDQGRDRAGLVAQARLELPGVEVRDEPHRNYPHGRLAAHVVGYMNHLSANELEQLAPRGYEPSGVHRALRP